MSNSHDLLNSPVWRALLGLAGPMVFGIVAVLSISVADTFYVSRLGTEPLAALSFTFPVTLTVASFSLGLGAGASSVVSRAVGAGNRDDARRLATDALVLALILVTLISALGFLSARPLFALLGAEGEILDMIVRYMQIWYVSVPFLVVPMVVNAVIRAVGDSFWPSLTMVLAALINIAITPFLIYGWLGLPALDVAGAAWGTLIARVLTMFIPLYILIWREHLMTLARPPLEALMSSWRRVLRVALPASLGSMVNPVGISVVTAIVATFGASTVAAFGVATRLESFFSVPMLALSAAIGPIAGQNWGAADKQRVIRALKLSYAVCAAWAAVLAILFAFTAEFFAGLLASEAAVAEEAATYLRIVPLSLFGYGIVIVAAGAFNALGKSVTGLGYYLLRSAVLYVPLAYAASLFAGSTAVYFGIAAANTLAGIAVAIYSLWWLGRAQVGGCAPSRDASKLEMAE